MSTNTKAVARWTPQGSEIDLDSNGAFVLLTDHERIVEDTGLLWARELVKRDDALAESLAEAERLRSAIERALSEIEDDGPKALKYAAQELRAAMKEHAE